MKVGKGAESRRELGLLRDGKRAVDGAWEHNCGEGWLSGRGKGDPSAQKVTSLGSRERRRE